MKIKQLLIIALFFLSACSSDEIPKDVLQPTEMRKVLWQMAVAEQLIAADTAQAVRTHLKDSTTFLYRRVLKDNKISMDEYKKSLRYYQSKPALMKLLVDTTESYGTAIKDTFQKYYKPKPVADKSAKKDSIGHQNPKTGPLNKRPFIPDTKFTPGEHRQISAK